MMGKAAVIAGLLLLSCCHIGQALVCYSCDYGTCLIPSKTTCGFIQFCGTETAKAGYIGMKKKGCIDPTDCLTESSVSYMGITVTTTRSCCFTELCNSAAAPKVSMITGVAVLLALAFAKIF